jgi:hydrogenase nickel incorporation protein HypB
MLATLDKPIFVDLDAPRARFFDEHTNRGAAALNRAAFIEASVFTITLFGGPGCGKTTLLRETLKRLGAGLRVGVVVCNIRAEDDAARVRPLCDQAIGIEAVELTPALLHEAMERIDLSRLDVLFIERGAGSAPHAVDLGQNATVGVFSACGGDDKAHRYADRIEHADLVLVTKSDLLPFIGFSRTAFRNAVREVNAGARVIELSCTGSSEAGLNEWCNWVRDHVHRPTGKPNETLKVDWSADYFVG